MKYDQQAVVSPSDCSSTLCPAIRCAPGFISQTPEGECCAICIKGNTR